ncbi:LacI family DNA-binding transcriptional regulator [Microbacterium dextranolyticum]|uniref:Transcriptional regulator n=1 Tax=Microbacterium dextranolyticum TaxID=36806 RepID=A0A9W6HPN8_9MICO|nr:LacI family DNA-binding transcriptional regulator [Microbacterium dextranolyticum]MBM7464051.1 DNA-binding LacI/PurR family transcriptional regulator [Microbacterium dextranolyticum]GLJ96619.1 transcriptional regulator [Microbacterium dextranolyticum]
MTDQATRGWQRPSIYDVAKQAGVSHMTVSRVLNGHPNIRDSTRERVLRAIEDMNYTRSSIARALATRRAMRIGVLVDGPVEYGPNSTLRALESAARHQGYGVSAFSVSDGAQSQMDDGLMELATEGVEALCVIAPRASSLRVLREHDRGLPTIVIKAEPDPVWHTIAVDQRAGAVEAVTYLIGIGHRRILHLAGPQDWYDARERQQGWADALALAGLDVIAPVVGDWTSDFGYEYGRTHDFGDATAVFAANDQMALGLMHGLAERGLRIPQDISVIGVDDLPDSRHFLPPLTTVQQDFSALGELALRQILAAIGGDGDVHHDVIEPVLVVRASTAPPRR